MKSWKDQLRDIKNALRGSGRGREPDDELPKIDFVPPPAWLAGDQPTPKKSSAQNSALRTTRLPGGKPTPKKPPARNPVPKPAAPVAAVVAPASTPPSFKPRIDDGCVLNMPAWSDVGRSLQHPEHRGERSAPMTVRVGLDFGTAFTKVAIRAGVDLVPVEWSAVTGDHSETGRYVVPGFVVRAPDGEFCWRRLTKADIRGNLKLPVIEMAGTDECPIATVAFLALVIRYARAFLYRNAEIGRKLAGRSLRWELNIGCPTEPHEKDEVVDIFQRIARTAWLLAAEDRLAEQDILAAWSLADAAIGLEAEPGVVPEFVAQIAGYLVSPQVRAGLHALIDIGAATLDVATFKVETSNEKRQKEVRILSASVRPLGTHYLRNNRHCCLGMDTSWNDSAPIESTEEFCQIHGLQLDAVSAIDDEFSDGVKERVIHGINVCRTRGHDGLQDNFGRYLKDSVWCSGFPLFVAGGGSRCNVYKMAIDNAQKNICNTIGSSGDFRFNEFNSFVSGIGSIVHSDMDRLSVAIGLTVDPDVRIFRLGDIKPLRFHKVDRISHEELYGD